MNTTLRANYFILMGIFKTNKVNFIYLNPFPEILDRPLHSIHMMLANYIHSESSRQILKKVIKLTTKITINSYFSSNNSLTMKKKIVFCCIVTTEQYTT